MFRTPLTIFCWLQHQTEDLIKNLKLLTDDMMCAVDVLQIRTNVVYQQSININVISSQINSADLS